VFTEVVLWRVPASLRGSTHSYKHRLALVADGICALRYDNEAGKGDHKHVGDRQVRYRFSGVDQLLADFSEDVRRRLDENGRV
jgi:hypothetical protein